MRYLPFWLAPLFLFACASPEAANRQAGTDSSHTNNEAVKLWLEKLPEADTSKHFLNVSEDVDPGPFGDRGYHRFSAAKLPGKRKYVAVLAACEFELNTPVSSSQLLVTYTPDGNEIARQEIGTLRLTVEGTQELRSWPVYINDTTIEVREERPQGKSQIRRMVLAADGAIRPVPPEKSPFDEYASRFPGLQLPLAISSAAIPKLKRVSPLTPWFSYQDIIGYDKLDIYHYGKIILPGKPLLLLYAYGPANDEGAVLDSAVQLVACKPDGTVTDQKDLYGKLFGEGVEHRWRNAVIHEDGSVTLEESIVNDADMALWQLGSTEARHMTYRLDAAGKFLSEVRRITYTVPAYTVNTLKEVFEQNKDRFGTPEGGHHKEMLFGIQDRMPFGILVWVHFYQHGEHQLAELVAMNDAGGILDRYVLYNYPETADYRGVAIPMDASQNKAYPVTNLTGPVTIQLAETTLQLTPEGKFVKP
ncbi:hypothetical protein HF324_07370 [Chitinophaga oryzae]|uniref:Uncharacterized protein n=1 Tax=Chitinophaga oryzae TaxID=2725414 RepID=A0AAE6ZDZ8_9BACT|nr:hypothetical protein [Chitinophaga oryzae]QJB31192.1 hypothetical protein HF329_07705 [Chitinophaga oryzae]QJB37680.1 hypothetical protein HF324_07370 [Chitinophaga oryzae]